MYRPHLTHMGPAPSPAPSHPILGASAAPGLESLSPAPSHPLKLRAKVSRKLMAGPWGPGALSHLGGLRRQWQSGEGTRAPGCWALGAGVRPPHSMGWAGETLEHQARW